MASLPLSLHITPTRFTGDTMNLPDVVSRRLETLGDEGARWLTQLPLLLSTYQARWDLALCEVMDGGSAALVYRATMSSRTPCVLKIPLPQQPSELPLLLMANGRGYAKVLRYADDAWVLEQLGAPLERVVDDPLEQLRISCQALKTAWIPATPQMDIWPNGAQKAADLRTWLQQGAGRFAQHQAAFERAMDYLIQRQQAHTLGASVLAHGDPHAQNLLQDEHGWKFIDPEGLVIEPAYDLGVLMREWSMDDLHHQPMTVGLRWCHMLSRWSGVDAESIWQWAMIERVSTALMFWHLNLPEDAERLLIVADHWAGR